MKQILLVGGNSGIGRQTVDQLLGQGHQLTIAARQTEELEGLLGASPQNFEATDREAKLELPEALDGVAYFPGTITLKPFHRLTPDDFAHEMEVNFHGAVRVLQQALPALKKANHGPASVVLFSTVAAGTGMPFHASIASAKAAVEGLARSLAAEWAPNIRVNVIAPSLTDTPLASTLLSSEEKVEAAAQRHPLKQVGDAADTADLVSFLMSDASRFITGQTFRPDGGLSSVKLF